MAVDRRLKIIASERETPHARECELVIQPERINVIVRDADAIVEIYHSKDQQIRFLLDVAIIGEMADAIEAGLPILEGRQVGSGRIQ